MPGFAAADYFAVMTLVRTGVGSVKACFPIKFALWALDPSNSERIYAGGEGARYIKLEAGEIFHSGDRGDTWDKIPLRFPIIYALAIQ